MLREITLENRVRKEGILERIQDERKIVLSVCPRRMNDATTPKENMEMEAKK